MVEQLVSAGTEWADTAASESVTEPPVVAGTTPVTREVTARLPRWWPQALGVGLLVGAVLASALQRRLVRRVVVPPAAPPV